MVTKPTRQAPLAWNIPIVDKTGQPTPEFIRKWQQQFAINGSIPDLSTAAAVSAVLDNIASTAGNILVRGSMQWAGMSLSQAVDAAFGNTRGSVLYRGATNWTTLTPGTAGFVLTTGGSGADPSWTASTGGVIIGAGVPTALEPAGTLYSRNDAAGVYASTPTLSGGVAVVQHTFKISNSGTPGSITLGSAPTVGNLIVVFVSWSEADRALPTINTTDWTQFIDVVSGSNHPAWALYRYAQFGDTTALPVLATGGATAYWGATVYEISGVTGTFATDMESHAGVVSAGSASTSTISSLATASPNALVLSHGGQYNGGTNPSISGTGSWTTDETHNNNSNFGSVACAHQTIAGSGTAITATWNFTGSDTGTTSMQAILKGSTGSLIAGWTLIGP